MSVRMPKSALKSRQKIKKTAEELEALIAERFGVLPQRVTVRGSPPDWTATLLVNLSGSAEMRGAFTRLVMQMQGEFDLKG